MRNLVRWAICLLGLPLVACSDSNAVSMESLPVEMRVEATRVEFFIGDAVAFTFDDGSEIDAFDADTDLAAWVTDDHETRLWLGHLSGNTVKRTQLDVPVDVHAICVGVREDGAYDLFLGDGDGSLYHFWLVMDDAPALSLVRMLATNPDVTVCDVGKEHVYVLNPPIGIVRYRRSAETDLVMELVYAPAPAGKGTVTPASFRLADRAGRLTVWDEDDQAWRIDTDRSGESSVIRAFPDRLPMSGGDQQAEAELPMAAHHLMPVLETEPVPDMGDAADDPVVIHGADGTAWIIGTNKQRGLAAYALDGAMVAVIDRGRLNNVDALPLTGGDHLLAASNRTHHTIDLFDANVAAGRLEFQRAIALDVDDPYGLCMGVWDNTVRVFVGGTDGEVQQWRLDPEAQRAGDLLEARYRFESQTEGCVLDPTSGTLYVGEEGRGIWSVPIASEGERTLFAGIHEGLLVPDVEGLDICHRPDGRWLIASSQGDDSFVSYDLEDRRAPFKFRIVEDVSRGIDGVSETDGLACTTGAITGFPEGVLVVQDGRNRRPEAPQNFKVVDLRALAAISEGL